MPEWSYNARQVMHAETNLWVSLGIVAEVKSGLVNEQWRDKAKSIQCSIQELANELRDYNEQFETEDD